MTDLIEDRWAALGRGESLAPPVVSPAPVNPHAHKTNYYHPFADAADEFVRWAQSAHERVFTGFPDLDKEMRGIAPGEMANIIGYSHSGKTLVLLEILKANRNKNVAFFTPDEPRTLVLIKLACVMHGVSAVDLERLIASDDSSSIDMLRSTALEHFPHLAVYDESVSLGDMEKATAEVSDVWGAPPDLVVFDYLELLQGGGEDVPSKANSLKAWGRRHEVPLLVLHQTSRSAGADGKKLSISSGAFGGEQQATHIVGVRRKKFDIQAQITELQQKIERSTPSDTALERLDYLKYEERLHAHTLTVNLVKNKRPGGQLIDDMDYEIETGTGRLTRLKDGNMPTAYLNELRAAA